MKASLFAVAALALAACSHSAPASQPEPQSQTNAGAASVKVENLSVVDMDVYVWSNGQRVRLGMVSGGETHTFPLSAAVIQVSPNVRFELRPIGGGRSPRTQTITVMPGDQVELQIPPS
jgi:hypothetical protein